MGKEQQLSTTIKNDKNKSAITNGSRMFSRRMFADAVVDGRTSWARRLRDLLTLHINDLGGEDMVSAAEKSIIRRVATLTVECELMEKKFALGNGARAEDLGLYITAANSLRRLLESIGLKRVARDVTPLTLNDIARDIASNNELEADDAK
jgi:hypothetical protein